MKQAERHLSDGVHPRLLCEGIELAKTAVLDYVDKVRIKKDCLNRDLLMQVCDLSSPCMLHMAACIGSWQLGLHCCIAVPLRCDSAD